MGTLRTTPKATGTIAVKPTYIATIGTAKVKYYFHATASRLKQLCNKATTVLVTDENIAAAHPSLFKGWNTIVIKPGEAYKTQQTIDSIISQLIALQVDRSWTLVGVGGGVITDMTGYAAAVYLRGIKVGFVPTTLLAMVDAAIGGKNGVDVGVFKNLVGTIRQPEFLLFDVKLLQSLPDAEWRSGMAEIIKHACIKDAPMFKLLTQHNLHYWQTKSKDVSALVERNAKLKTKVVISDEKEQGDRKLLNFGHTLGHALENQYQLSHGEAISIGMTYAALLSESITGCKKARSVIDLLEQYGLPTFATFDAAKAIEVLRMDKKRTADTLHFILLEKLGKGVVHPILLTELEKLIKQYGS